MGLIPLLLVVVLILLIFRGGARPPWRVWTRGNPPVRDPIQLILFVIVVLLLIGLLVNLVAPLGDYRVWPR